MKNAGAALKPAGAALPRFLSGLRLAVAMALTFTVLSACTKEEFQKGYILPPGALEQIPIGASQDQVLIVMGTPSTVATLDGEVFYYITIRAWSWLAPIGICSSAPGGRM